jgi:hypothetical protein
MVLVQWMASGLSDTLTGIERLALTLVEQLASRQIVQPTDLVVVSEQPSEWLASLEEVGAHVHLVRSSRWKKIGGVEPGVRVVHSLGGSPLPTLGNSDATSLFSIYDWGPLRDRQMPLKARLAWSSVMVRGLRDADLVHFVNPLLSGSRPRYLPKPRREVVAAGGSTLEPPAAGWKLPRLCETSRPLFVGSGIPRKRVDAIAHMAVTSKLPVNLVGDGTAAYCYPPWVEGHGRVSDTTLARMLGAASALILVSSYEGFGIPVYEAAVRGICSVVSPSVFSVLPAALQAFAYVTDPDDPVIFEASLAQAINARGRQIYQGASFLQPLLDVYASVLNDAV